MIFMIFDKNGYSKLDKNSWTSVYSYYDFYSESIIIHVNNSWSHKNDGSHNKKNQLKLTELSNQSSGMFSSLISASSLKNAFKTSFSDGVDFPL